MARSEPTRLTSWAAETVRQSVMVTAICVSFTAGIPLIGPNTAFALSASPSALSFTGTQGSVNPAAQSVEIWKRGDREKSWAVSTASTWLSVSPTSGSISNERDQITVAVDLANMNTGTYRSTVTITSTNVRGRTNKTVIPVSLTIIPTTSTTSFAISPSQLTFNGTVGSGNQTIPVTVTNTGTSPLALSWSEGLAWLTAVQPGSAQTVEPGQHASFTTTASFAGLAAGSYGGAITIAGGGATKSLPVSLTLTGASTTPVIGINPGNLGFSGTAGGTNPSAKTVTVTNTGTGTLSWTISDNAAWLTMTPASGTNSGTASATVNLAGLSTGTYNATVSVSAPGAATKSIPVALTVNPAPQASPFTVSPATMSYTGTVGGPAVVAGVAITNTSSTTLSVTWKDSINWLVATSGDTVSVAPGGTATITHTASTVGLAAGTYSGTASLSGGGITTSVPVSFIVSASPATTTSTVSLTPASLAFTGALGGNNPASKSVTVAKTGTGAVTWTASDNAAWLTLSPATGTATGTFTASVNTTGLAAGSYSAMITVTAPGAANTPQNIPVTLTVTAGTATSATLTWAANTESDLAGYNIYAGTQSGVYGTPVSVGKVTSHVLTNLTNGTTYFFTITAYDSAGNESPQAAEVSKSIF